MYNKEEVFYKNIAGKEYKVYSVYYPKKEKT